MKFCCEKIDSIPEKTSLLQKEVATRMCSFLLPDTDIVAGCFVLEEQLKIPEQ